MIGEKMSDPAITIFEIVQEYLGRKHKIEWKAVQAEINRQIKVNKSLNNKEVKQQVFSDIETCISRIVNTMVADFQVKLAATLVERFVENAKPISAEIVANNPDFAATIKGLLCDSLGRLEHGLNERQWKIIDEARCLLGVCYRIGENIGINKTKEAFKTATKDLLAVDYKA